MVARAMQAPLLQRGWRLRFSQTGGGAQPKPAGGPEGHNAFYAPAPRRQGGCCFREQHRPMPPIGGAASGPKGVEAAVPRWREPEWSNSGGCPAPNLLKP